jgi:outer membrane receptor protein involved in Fe transport
LRFRYELNERTTTFVGLSKGYKAGGFNLGVVPDDRREFGQEALWSLDMGVRFSWLDDAVLLNGTAFFSRRGAQQVRTSYQAVPNDPASFVFFTDNAARGRTHGLEAELRYRPDGSWSGYASVGLLKAVFTEFLTADANLGGRDQAHAPHFTAAVGGAYRHPSGWFARLDVSARDEFYFDVSHNQKSNAYGIANATLGYDNERFTVQLLARNIFDEHYAVRGFYFENEPPDFPTKLYIRQGDPRQLGITLDVRF